MLSGAKHRLMIPCPSFDAILRSAQDELGTA